LPNDIALTKIVRAKMKIITDALPTMLIILRTTCCPTKAAILATAIKYSAETYPEKIKQVSKQVNGFPGFFIIDHYYELRM